MRSLVIALATLNIASSSQAQELDCAKELAEVWALVSEIKSTADRQFEFFMALPGEGAPDGLGFLMRDPAKEWREYAVSLQERCFPVKDGN